MNPGIGVLPLPSANSPPKRRADERVEVSATSCPWDEKLYFKADEPKVGQRHENVERNWEYYYIIIFPEQTYDGSS